MEHAGKNKFTIIIRGSIVDVFCHCIANTSARMGWDDPGLRFNLQGGRGWGSGTEEGWRGWEACWQSYGLTC